MKRPIRYFWWMLLALILLALVNICCYTFWGQYRSDAKLQAGEELNLYECCSIYSTHLAMCAMGWTIAPEAARECLYLHFTDKDTVCFRRVSKEFLASEKLKIALEQLHSAPYGVTSASVGTVTRIILH